MYNIQLNESGTRNMNVTEQNLQTIQKYNLFNGLISSTGYVTENDLDKLKLNIRSLIASSSENTKDLLDLCFDVIYHDKMKAFGLKNLIAAFNEWQALQPTETENKPTSTRNFPVNYREELNVLNVGSSFFRKNSVGRMLGIACLRSAKL